jgi:hypothetical protein
MALQSRRRVACYPSSYELSGPCATLIGVPIRKLVTGLLSIVACSSAFRRFIADGGFVSYGIKTEEGR